MRFQCRPASACRSRVEEAERPKPVLPLDANPGAAHAHPQPAQAEDRSRGTRTAPLPAREVRSARRRRQVERLLPALRSRPHFPREPPPQPALGSRSRAALLRSALRSAWADCLSPAAEGPAVADIRTPTAPPYPHDRAARNETRVGRLP